MSDLVLSQVV